MDTLQVGDMVWVSIKNWKTQRPSKKLNHQMAGPYKIIEKCGHSWKIKLPDSIKIWPVFHTQLFRKAATDPLPGQINESPLPIQIEEGDEEWEVKKILASKVKRKKVYYRASWVGYDKDPEWYPASNFKYSSHKLRAFHEEYPQVPGPPRSLPKWQKAWEEGRDTYEELDDDYVS